MLSTEGDNKVEFLHSEPSNSAVLTAWHSNECLCVRHIISKSYVVFVGKHVEKDIPMIIINVYSPRDIHEKISLCDDLSHYKGK